VDVVAHDDERVQLRSVVAQVVQEASRHEIFHGRLGEGMREIEASGREEDGVTFRTSILVVLVGRP
jgi:hypothetical protein